jgi:transcriptional regulator GlxA family with amidase domain
MLYNTPRVDIGGTAVTARSVPLSVGFVLLPRFSLLALGSMVDLLGHASDDAGGFRQQRCSWTLMSPVSGPVVSSAGVEVAPPERLGEPRRYDHVVVLAGPSPAAYAGRPEFEEYLRRCRSERVSIVGIGGGAEVLAQAGLLTRRKCCVHWEAFAAFARTYPEVTPIADQLFLVDDGLITCAGEASAADLVAWLIEQRCEMAITQTALDRSLSQTPRRGNAAQPHPALDQNIEHERVRRAVILMQQRLHEPYDVSEIAARVNLSKRQLERLFLREIGNSVQAYSRQLRLHHGLWKLMHTQQSVTSIAQDCGFADSSHFCRKFAEVFGASPSTVRRQPKLALELTARHGARRNKEETPKPAARQAAPMPVATVAAHWNSTHPLATA